MSEALKREVEIILKLLPDGQNSKAVEKLATEIEKAQQKAANAHNRTSDAQVAAATKAERAAERTVDKELALHRQRQEASRKVTDRQLIDQERASAAANAALMGQEEKSIAAMESGMRLADQFLTLAEGAAMLGIAGEEDVEKLAKGFVKVRAAVDLVRGGFGVFLEMSKHLLNLRKLAEATAASQRAVAAASAAGGATSAAASAGGSAAAGAAGAAGGVTFAGALATGAGFLAGGAVLYEAVAAAARNLFGVSERAESLATLLPSLVDAAFAAEQSFTDVARNQSEYAESRLFNMRNEFESRRERGALSVELARIDRGEGAAAKEMLRIAREQISVGEGNVQAAQRPDVNITEEQRLRLVEEANLEIRAGRQAEVEALRKVRDYAEDRLQFAREETSAAKERLMSASEMVKIERERERDTMARFGRLDPGQQAQIRRIAENQAAGKQLTEQEARILDQSGFGRGVTDKFYAQRGAAAGGATIFQQLEGGLQGGGQQQLAKANAEFSEAIRKEGVARQEAKNATLELRDSILTLQDELAKLREAIANARRDANNTTENSVGRPQAAASEQQSAFSFLNFGVGEYAATLY